MSYEIVFEDKKILSRHFFKLIIQNYAVNTDCFFFLFVHQLELLIEYKRECQNIVISYSQKLTNL